MRQRQTGFTMIELMLVMGVMAVMGLLASMQQERQARQAVAEAAGNELAQVSAAVDTFITTYAESLVGQDESGNVIAMDPSISAPTPPAGPTAADVLSFQTRGAHAVQCNATVGIGRLCDIPAGLLGDLGLMPNNWNGEISSVRNSGSWIIRTKVGSGLNTNSYIVNALVISEKPFQLGDGTPDGALAGRATIASKMIAAGVVRDVSATATPDLRFSSRNGDFSLVPGSWDWPGAPLRPGIANAVPPVAAKQIPSQIANSEHQFGALAGLNSSQTASVFLRRDGRLPMLGDLNMGAVDAAAAAAYQAAHPQCGTANHFPCLIVSPGYSVKLGKDISNFSGSIDMAQNATFGGNQVVGGNQVITGNSTANGNFWVKGTSQLDGVTTIGTAATAKTTHILNVNGSADIKGAIKVLGGGTQSAANAGSYEARTVTGDTIESLIAGPKVHIRDAYVWDLDVNGGVLGGDYRTSPKLSTLLPVSVIKDTQVIQKNGNNPVNVVKPVCSDAAKATPQIYVHPHVFMSTQDISITAQKLGFNIYAVDMGSYWTIKAFDAAGDPGTGVGITLSDFYAVVTIGCSYEP